MQKRGEVTRQALIRATAELIAAGGPGNAGLVNICRRAGVSRGALYHHFSTTEELAAEVYAQARAAIAALADTAFAGPAESAAARFSSALGAALRDDPTVRAGMQLGPDGSSEPPRLREEVLDSVRLAVAGRLAAERGLFSQGVRDLAELAVAVTAGLESLGHVDRTWWEPKTSERVWRRISALFDPARGGSAGPDESSGPAQLP
ncbi:TetR family transcriptional regulator [Streptomyces sp. NPDC001678]|uniref:TetR family transcriptional regulator n=1 Tax=Streptomyces sp. NPDC001678 TaxID=3364599 RepID=UPI0036B6294C